MKASARGIELAVSGDDAAWCVLGDEDLLVTALRNLLENAVAYSPEKTRVVVSATRDGPDAVEISVADQGIGIPERDLERIFERFYRVDPARSRATGGTGLGPGHRQARGGRPRRRGDRVEQGGRGVHLHPAAAARSGQRRPPTAAPTAGRAQTCQGGSQVTRVLVVEDEESFSDALSYMLRKEGFEVAVCPTGPDALDDVRPQRRRPRPARPHAARPARQRGLPDAAASGPTCR